MTRTLLTGLAATVALVLIASGGLVADVRVKRFSKPFILNGTSTNITEFPWQVMLKFQNHPVCGGTILSDVWILTAAHCTLLLDEVLVGTDVRSAGGHHHKVDKFHRHPNFMFLGHDYDIAVVKVASPFTFSDTIEPVGSLAFEEPDEGSPVTVTGWGKDQENATSLSEHLTQVVVNIVPRATCNDTYGAVFTPRMFCAASPGRAACQGDSGGPVVKANTTELVGIVSWGEGCARKNMPGVYTSVAVLRGWIKEMTGI